MDKYDTFSKRIGAALIDGVVFIPFSFLEAIVRDSISFILVGFLYLFLWSSYTIGLHYFYGQTLGKKVTGVKVYDVFEKATLSFRQALMRESVWILAQLLVLIYVSGLIITNNKPFDDARELYSILASGITFIWILIESITMLANRKRRSMQDFIARSVVLKID